MADIALAAGVSKITVSRALADSATVKRATRDHVRAVAERMGYKLNVAARNLRLQRTAMIAVVIEMMPTAARPMSEPYPLSLLGGIIQELSEQGYSAVLSTADNFIRVPPSVDAVILLGQGVHDDAVRSIERCNLPFVIWGSVRNDAEHVIVGSDNLTGGALAAQRFVELGRKRAVFLGDAEHAEIADRLDGFVDRLSAHGIEPVAIQSCKFTFDGGHGAMTALFNHYPDIDAVFAASDSIAMGAARALVERGIQIPQQATVIGFDDSAGAALFIPALSTIRQDWIEGGRLLARKALGQIQGERAMSHMMPVQLVLRDS